MSLNQIYDNQTRTYSHPVRFKNIKLNDEQLNNIIFNTDKADIDYSEELVGNYYFSLKDGNSELYSYNDSPYTIVEKDISSLYSNVVQVTTAQELIDAVNFASDYDRIQLLNNISITGQLSITKSIEIFALSEITLLSDNIIFVNAPYVFFNNVVLSTTFLNNTQMIILANDCIDTVFKGCDFGATIGTIRKEADSNLYIYDSSFYHLGPQQEAKRLIELRENNKKVFHVKRCNIYGDGVTGDTKTEVIRLNNDGTNIELDIVIENCTLGSVNLSPNTAIKSLINTLYPCNKLNIYLNSNQINTIEKVVEIKNNEFLGGIGNMQIYDNTVSMSTGKESNFTGVFYAIPQSGNFTYVNNKDARVRAYKNVIVPDSTKENAIPSSAYDNALLTSEYGGVPLYEFRKINPLYIETISIDNEPGVGYVFNPLTNDLLGANNDILNLNKVQTSILQANAIKIDVSNKIDMNGNNFDNVNEIYCKYIEGDTPTYGLLINSDVAPDGDNIWHLGHSSRYWVETYTKNIRVERISARDINDGIEINANLVPTTQTDIGNSTSPFDEVFANTLFIDNLDTTRVTNDLLVKCNFLPDTNNAYDLGFSSSAFKDTYTLKLLTNELQALTGGITSNNSINPNTNKTKDLGSGAAMWRDVYTDRVRTNYLDGYDDPTILLQGNLTPDSNNSRTLGNASAVYKEMWTRGLLSEVTIVFTPVNNTNAKLQMSDTYFRSIGNNIHSLGQQSNKFTVAYITNGVVTGSSLTIKKDIVDCKMKLDFIDKLQPKMYRYIDDEDDAPMRCGLIYEDVKQVVEESGMTFRALHNSTESVDDENGEPTGEFKEHYGINYESFVAPLIGAVKELKQQNEALLKRIEVLEAK